ncbi:glycosyltransferase family 2 protein [Desulfogranum japonicum]|uniref:glycosyltransferase family 2 protein n=1 Tax=Desulfogranum japonicum TaxID=231447 RepID=UPI000425731B|nr:glycosyltransferase family 2 protein [Desulfogranum japonicum]
MVCSSERWSWSAGNEQEIYHDLAAEDVAFSRSMSARVLAVIPTYLPQREHLGLLCTDIAEQVDHILLVDNSTFNQAWLHELTAAKISVEVLGTNVGIAAAQNKGVQYAEKQGFDFVLFLDQDSRPTRGMVKALVDGYHALMKQGLPVAAVGPATYMQSPDTLEPFYTTSRWGLGSRHCCSPKDQVEVAYLHASGTLVCTRIFSRVGLLAENLFIDMVDMEWCFRARKQGYLCFGLCRALLQHQVGEVYRPLSLKKMPQLSVHAPLRGYYQVRNIVLLMRGRCASPMLLCHYFLRRVLCRFLAQLVFAGNRRERLMLFVKGLMHGLQGIEGPYKSFSKKI